MKDEVAKALKTLGYPLEKPLDFEVLKKLYRVSVKKAHPDKASGSAEQFKAVKKAYDISVKYGVNGKIYGQVRVSKSLPCDIEQGETPLSYVIKGKFYKI